MVPTSPRRSVAVPPTHTSKAKPPLPDPAKRARATPASVALPTTAPPKRTAPSPTTMAAPTQDVLSPYLTRQQTAAILHCTVQGVDRLIHRGKLTGYKPLRRVLIRRDELLQAVQDAQL